MLKLAVYGKGGIGKSTIASNMSYAFAVNGKKVVHIGCDPKCDSSRPLLGHRPSRTVTEYIRNVLPSKRKLSDVIEISREGIVCVEAGGPKPGVGCAGKGIISTLDSLRKMDIGSVGADVTIYDVLGDVVCGGFAVPMRENYSDGILIVTSGEFMSIFAANNIMKGSLNFQSGEGRILGLILNRRGTKNETEIVNEFSHATGIPIVCTVERSELIGEAESRNTTVMELYPDSGPAKAIKELVSRMDGLIKSGMHVPRPLTDTQLDTLFVTGMCKGMGEYRDSVRVPPITCDMPIMKRRIGKGPVSAVLEAGKVYDMPILVQGTSNCGFTMALELSMARMRRLHYNRDAAVPSSGNVFSTEMTPDSSVYGGASFLTEGLEKLSLGNDTIMVISTCLSGMIGDDNEHTIGDFMKAHDGTNVLYVDANRADAGVDAHMEVLKALIGLIDTSVEPEKQYVNIVDDSFVAVNEGRNKEYLDEILGWIGLELGPGFLNDCRLSDVINTRRYGAHVLGDERRDNKALKKMLEDKGIVFTESPLPRGFYQTAEWIRQLCSS